MIFLISKVTFDTYENRIGDAVQQEILGYALDRVEAVTAVRELEAATTPYLGWDNKTYPQFGIIEVPRVNHGSK